MWVRGGGGLKGGEQDLTALHPLRREALLACGRRLDSRITHTAVKTPAQPHMLAACPSQVTSSFRYPLNIKMGILLSISRNYA